MLTDASFLPNTYSLWIDRRKKKRNSKTVCFLFPFLYPFSYSFFLNTSFFKLPTITKKKTCIRRVTKKNWQTKGIVKCRKVEENRGKKTKCKSAEEVKWKKSFRVFLILWFFFFFQYFIISFWTVKLTKKKKIFHQMH